MIDHRHRGIDHRHASINDDRSRYPIIDVDH